MKNTGEMSTKGRILLTLEDMIADFLYYDRKEDEELPRGAIEKAIRDGEITIDDIVEKVKYALEQGLA